MAEWLYEAGIGEARAALVDDGRIVEARIERDDAGPRWGTRHRARLGPGWRDRRVVDLEDGGEAFLDRLAAPASDGETIMVQITREAIRGPRETKLPLVCHMADDGAAGAAALFDELEATGIRVVQVYPHMPDLLEAAGWSEMLDQALTGDVAFAGGVLHIDLTRGMTVIDVDGAPPLDRLALAGADAAARAIVRLGIAGSIAIDFPTLGNREQRLAASAAFDAVFAGRGERTGINGFGLMQIVREKRRASFPELLQGDPVGAEARALLRRAERSRIVGAATLVAHPAIIARIAEHASWTASLARTIGGTVGLRADPALAMAGSHVESA